MADSVLYRVKVYKLSANSLAENWQDDGTGYLSTLNDLNPMITVKSEADESELVNSPVTKNVNFHKREETLILWEDEEGDDHAISFQEKNSCDVFYDKIESIKDSLKTDVDTNSGEDEPTPKTLNTCITIDDATQVVHTLISGGNVEDMAGFISSLISLYNSEGNVARKRISSLVKILIQGDRKDYFPAMLCRTYIDGVILILSGETETRFQFIGEPGQDKLTTNLEIVFKTLFIRDISYNPQTVLERETVCRGIGLFLSDMVEDTLKLFKNCPFLVNFFTNIVDDPSRADLLVFALQIVRLTQVISSTQSYCQVLVDAGLIKALDAVLKSDESNSTAVAILLHLIDKTPTVIRDCLQDRKELIQVLVHIIVHDPDPELKTGYEILTALRQILDSESITDDPKNSSRQHFVDVHFRLCLPSLLEPLFRVTELTRLLSDDRKTANYLVLLLDHITLQVPNYANQLHTLNIDQGLLIRVVALVNSRHNLLVLSSIRYFKEVMLYRPSYMQFVITHRLLDCLVPLLSSGRYNMINSALLEFFENTCDTDSIDLAAYIISEYYESHLSRIDYTKTFTKMKAGIELISKNSLSYDESCDSQYMKELRSEEEWFNSDDEGTTNQSSVDDCLEFERASDAIVRLRRENMREEDDLIIRRKTTQPIVIVTPSCLLGQSGSLKRSLVDYDSDSDDDEIANVILNSKHVSPIQSPSKRSCID